MKRIDEETTLRRRPRTLALLLSLVVIVAIPIHTDAAPPNFSSVGSFKSEGPIYLDEVARLLYQIKFEVSGITIKILDLDSLSERPRVGLPGSLESFVVQPHRGAGSHMAEGGLAAVDSNRHRLFYPYRDPRTAALHMAVIDGTTGQVTSYAVSLPIPTSDAGVGIESMAYRAQDDTLFLLAVTPLPAAASQATGGFHLVALEGTSGKSKPQWTRSLTECSSLFPNRYMMPPLGVTGDNLYLGCSVGTNVLVLTAGTALVMKMKLATNGIDKVKTFASPILPLRGIYDPASERMFYLGNKLMAAFDGVHESWIGLAVPGNRPQLGLNGSIGRLFMCGQEGSAGLFFTDAARATPVPPPIAAPQINCMGTESWPIVSDGKTGRVFVEIRKPDGVYWTALSDPVPAYVPPPHFDPDLGAEDVDEVPGLTQSSFSSQSGAYGTRVIWIGGPMGAVENSTILAADIIRDNGFRTSLRFGEGSRELRLARVAAGKMSDQGVEGAAIAADRDARLETDFETLRQHPANRGLRDGAAARGYTIPEEPTWRYEPAMCVGYGGETDVPSASSPQDLANVVCDYEDKMFKGDARAEEHEIPGVLVIGESTASVKNYRDPTLGAISEAEAVSRNINIGNLVSIAEARAVSKAWAKGRPGTANTSYERTFRGVHVKRPDGSTAYQCTTVKECNLDQVISAINSALGPRVTARLPQPEPEFLNGTPKGTTSSFRQNEWEQLEEQVLYDKPVEDLTMAAFELHISANVLSGSGYIVKLAGVTSNAGYRTFKLPQPIPLPPLDPGILVAGQDLGPSIVDTPPPSGPQEIVRKVVEKIRTGMEWVFGVQSGYRSVVASWAMFLAPLYLIIRRRTMLRETIRALTRSAR